MKKRRRGRELCLKILYQWDIQKDDIKSQIEDFWKYNPTPDDIQSFTARLAEGTYNHIKEIDSTIERFSEHWTLGRINKIDKNIMRSAVYELLYEDEIPSNVTINEAIDIAKKYGTEDSGHFVNGILDRIKKELQCDKKKNVKD
ncbi:MAG: transcription antitermination factor NusB [Nitrospinae bacterium RIFCSPLOWO2_12_39_16]|nr:MAG: transcription antitermination factor NusB [Nitrospinae bacterium RIFCSPLOWO2_12_39_16]